MHRYSIFIGFILLLLTACNSNKKEMIIGDWQACAFTQEDSLIQIDLSQVRLSINPDGTYCYYSNLKHYECGTYILSKNILSLQDTILKNSTSYNLALNFIHKDSLQIRMTKDSVNQNLFFKK
jgi:hypothetical protein